MIDIVIKNNNYISITGHSLPDICASVSSIMYTTINALLSYNETYIKFIDDGSTMELEILNHDDITDMLFDNMCNMLNDLYTDCKEFININKIED